MNGNFATFFICLLTASVSVADEDVWIWGRDTDLPESLQGRNIDFEKDNLEPGDDVSEKVIFPEENSRIVSKTEPVFQAEDAFQQRSTLSSVITNDPLASRSKDTDFQNNKVEFTGNVQQIHDFVSKSDFKPSQPFPFKTQNTFSRGRSSISNQPLQLNTEPAVVSKNFPSVLNPLTNSGPSSILQITPAVQTAFLSQTFDSNLPQYPEPLNDIRGRELDDFSSRSRDEKIFAKNEPAKRSALLTENPIRSVAFVVPADISKLPLEEHVPQSVSLPSSQGRQLESSAPSLFKRETSFSLVVRPTNPPPINLIVPTFPTISKLDVKLNPTSPPSFAPFHQLSSKESILFPRFPARESLLVQNLSLGTKFASIQNIANSPNRNFPAEQKQTSESDAKDTENPRRTRTVNSETHANFGPEIKNSNFQNNELSELDYISSSHEKSNDHENAVYIIDIPNLETPQWPYTYQESNELELANTYSPPISSDSFEQNEKYNHDAEIVNSKMVDFGIVDSKMVDSGIVDSKMVDSGIVDSKMIDFGIVDSKMVDSGILDSDIIGRFERTKITKLTPTIIKTKGSKSDKPIAHYPYIEIQSDLPNYKSPVYQSFSEVEGTRGQRDPKRINKGFEDYVDSKRDTSNVVNENIFVPPNFYYPIETPQNHDFKTQQAFVGLNKDFSTVGQGYSKVNYGFLPIYYPPNADFSGLNHLNQMFTPTIYSFSENIASVPEEYFASERDVSAALLSSEKKDDRQDNNQYGPNKEFFITSDEGYPYQSNNEKSSTYINPIRVEIVKPNTLHTITDTVVDGKVTTTFYDPLKVTVYKHGSPIVVHDVQSYEGSNENSKTSPESSAYAPLSNEIISDSKAASESPISHSTSAETPNNTYKAPPSLEIDYSPPDIEQHQSYESFSQSSGESPKREVTVGVKEAFSLLDQDDQDTILSIMQRARGGYPSSVWKWPE